jgi:hypothetical protein
MGEVIRFIPRSERERIRLIREARAIYDSIFPSASVTEQGERAPIGHAINSVNAYGNNGVRS